MPRAGPRKVQRYSLAFKLKAVKLSQLKGVEVQAVADALAIHPFMLSRWRKEARDGVLRGRVALPDAKKAPTAPWKTHRASFPQLPQAIITLANEREVTARLCHLGDREAVSLRRIKTMPPSPDLYFDTIFAFQRSAALKSAIELDLFTAIDDGARTMQEIATASGAPDRGIRILCDYLTTIGFITKTGDTYELTEDSAVFLSKRSPAYVGGTAVFLHSEEVTGHFEGLTETIRRGAPRTSLVAVENPAWVQFARAMVPMMMPAAQAIADLLDVASAGPMRVVDLAAGHGIFGIAIAQRNPTAEIVAVDWAPVLEVAAENAQAMGVGARHRTVAGDGFTVDYGGGFDVALVTNFLHHFDRQANVAFLRKTAGALKNGGRVVVLEFVPNEDRVTPTMAARFSLVMLAGTHGGDAYTFRELQEMLTEAGFTDVTAHPLHGPETVLIATK